MTEEPFWQAKSLAEMTPEEWESLCDSCGKCCLHKLADDSQGLVYFTDVACQYLDESECRCQIYPNRFIKVPDCIQVTPDAEFSWLPPSCSYRRLSEGRGLPSWHPLVVGNRNLMEMLGVSVKGRVRAENDNICLEEHMVEWPLSDIE